MEPRETTCSLLLWPPMANHIDLTFARVLQVEVLQRPSMSKYMRNSMKYLQVTNSSQHKYIFVILYF